ncbi:MAG TPA: ADP-forming succinate--CoA ligase subunit beta [Proteobacteria bacterium]|nr:succinyl-CoA ligase [ADP-forming] subunit beta [bacterium BMS3Abin14]HDL54178.1 ADP-forming succinate--CoA ligase subunit beta [Pseudomonadota bacterium]
MKVHEYQAKQLLREYGVPVPDGGMGRTPAEARKIAEELGGKVVVKAQIHAGGRGKAGGVKLVSGPAEAEKVAGELIGKTLITHQTGPGGKVVNQILIEGGVEIASEFYLGMAIDRATERVAIMASTEGGVEIEKVAAEAPEKILKEFVDPAVGLMPFQARKIAFNLGLTGKTASAAASFVLKLYRLFMDKDCSLAEINPLITTATGEVIALDAKLNFDDNALFRHPDIVELRDLSEEQPQETEASEYGLSYIKLEGNVGCMVNGAGLAMSTMDIIKLAGGEPANFLDVGGAAKEESVTNAFRIILSDKNVKVVLVNIFGGIVRCDIVAQGVINAAKNLNVTVPVVVRLEGTNAKEGLSLIEKSGMKFITAKGLKAAAEQAVAAAKSGEV